MIDAARRDYPGLRFKVGSMADLPLGDASVAGLLAFWSLVHIPNAVPVDFRRVLGPGGRPLLGFHARDGSRLKAQGYGGHPMKVYVHRRQPERVAACCAMPGSRSRRRCSSAPTPAFQGESCSRAASPSPASNPVTALQHLMRRSPRIRQHPVHGRTRPGKCQLN